jgi:ubiquitin C-terminal hydrolase
MLALLLVLLQPVFSLSLLSRASPEIQTLCFSLENQLSFYSRDANVARLGALIREFPLCQTKFKLWIWQTPEKIQGFNELSDLVLQANWRIAQFQLAEKRFKRAEEERIQSLQKLKLKIRNLRKKLSTPCMNATTTTVYVEVMVENPDSSFPYLLISLGINLALVLYLIFDKMIRLIDFSVALVLGAWNWIKIKSQRIRAALIFAFGLLVDIFLRLINFSWALILRFWIWIKSWRVKAAPRATAEVVPSEASCPPHKIITTPRTKMCGLKNIGNNCYANSVIQALSLSDHFVENLQAIHFQDKSLGHLKNLISTIRNSESDAEDPGEFLNAVFDSPASLFEKNVQSDAAEFLKAIFFSLKNELFVHGMRHCFEGTLRTRVKCLSCNRVSISECDFNGLDLGFQEKARFVELQSMLNSYFQETRLQGSEQYNCLNCSALRDAQLIYSISSYPELLILSMKRFLYIDGSLRKKSTLVDFPERIKVGMDGAEYALSACIFHSGYSAHSGHYFAVARNSISSEEWFLFDDAKVSRISKDSEEWLSGDPYLFFYAKC